MATDFTAQYAVVVDLVVGIDEDTANQIDRIEGGTEGERSLLQTITTALNPRSAFQAREDLTTDQVKRLLLIATDHTVEIIRELLDSAIDVRAKLSEISLTHKHFSKAYKEEKESSPEIGAIEILWNVVANPDDHSRYTRRLKLLDSLPEFSKAMGTLLNENIEGLQAAESELNRFGLEFRKPRRYNFALPILAHILRGSAKRLTERRAELPSIKAGIRPMRLPAA